MHEFDLIRTYLSPLATHTAALGLRDDASLLTVPEGHELVITKDAIIESVHFVGDEPPALIAQKLLRVNLSDLAAMGATPLGYFLALMLPSEVDEAWIQDFTTGLKQDQEHYNLSLLGGDTTHIPGPLALSATMLGIIPTGQALRRNGAQAGDDVYVTGTLGDAALGLEIALGNEATNDYLLTRYRLPEPRLELAESLRMIATSCIDISDGIMQDLGHICKASGVGAEIEWEKIPLSPAARMLQNSEFRILNSEFRQTILTGGDDYELLFTALPEVATALEAIAQETRVPITRIGRMIKGSGPVAFDETGKRIALTREGYTHF